MRNLSAPASIALMLVCAVTSFTAPGPAIGSVTATGSFLVDSSKVWRSTTLFDGSTVETNDGPSNVRLNDGGQVRLGADSRAKVYRNRVVLEKGLTQLQTTADTPLEARTLKVYSASADSVGQMRLSESNKVIVAAVRGSLRVTNASGVLVANLAAPAALTFDPQVGGGAASPTRLSGCLLSRDGKFVVVDQTTNVTMEVYGATLDKQLGNRVEVSGTADVMPAGAAGSAERVHVTDMKLIAKGGCASVAKKVGAAVPGGVGGAAAGGASAAGISTAATVAVVGGVAVGGALGGLAAAGSFSGSDQAPSTSR